MEKTIKSNKEWKRILSPAQYAVLRDKATEPKGTSPLLHNHEKGTYHCVACDHLIFKSEDKFDSGTGWPSFKDIAKDDSVILQTDADGIRTEVLCWKCEGHLGHVFEDGPAPTYQRYCMNGVALKFKKVKGGEK